VGCLLVTPRNHAPPPPPPLLNPSVKPTNVLRPHLRPYSLVAMDPRPERVHLQPRQRRLESLQGPVRHPLHQQGHLLPTFGDGDFCISSNSNHNQQSFSSGQSYSHPLYNRAILAGAQFFQTVEIEVYTKAADLPP
jgi:hypothetical protein